MAATDPGGDGGCGSVCGGCGSVRGGCGSTPPSSARSPPAPPPPSSSPPPPRTGPSPSASPPSPRSTAPARSCTSSAGTSGACCTREISDGSSGAKRRGVRSRRSSTRSARIPSMCTTRTTPTATPRSTSLRAPSSLSRLETYIAAPAHQINVPCHCHWSTSGATLAVSYLRFGPYLSAGHCWTWTALVQMGVGVEAGEASQRWREWRQRLGIAATAARVSENVEAEAFRL